MVSRATGYAYQLRHLHGRHLLFNRVDNPMIRLNAIPKPLAIEGFVTWSEHERRTQTARGSQSDTPGFQ